MLLGEVIKNFRTEHKLSMDSFSKMSGITKGYISMLEKNEHPKTKKPIIPTFETIEKVAKGMGVSVEKLVAQLEGDQEIQINVTPNYWNSDECSQLQKTSTLIAVQETTQQLDPLRQKKVLTFAESQLKEQSSKESEVSEKIIALDNYRKRVDKSVPGKVSAGTGYWQEDDYNTMVSFYEDEIPDNDKYNTIAIVVGHSMEPRIKNGDFLFIKIVSQVEIGDIGIFRVNGENFVKQLKQGYLKSLNPDYDDIYLSPNDDIRTIGEVVDIYREK